MIGLVVGKLQVGVICVVILSEVAGNLLLTTLMSNV